MPAEDQTLTTIRMSKTDLDLDILPDQREDPQVAFWRDEYGMWVEELEATLSGECEFMFEGDIMVQAHVCESILLICISGLSHSICP